MAEKQIDEVETDDIELDTEDVLDEEDDVKSREPTEPDLSSPRKPHRIRMPSKTEIVKAVESVRTESLEVDAATRDTAAQSIKVEDVD